MNHTRIGEIMTEDVVTLESGQAAPAAQELLRMLHVRHLPVVNKAGELVGLVTHRKLLAEHARLLQQTSEQSETGDDSRDFALAIPISKVNRARNQHNPMTRQAPSRPATAELASMHAPPAAPETLRPIDATRAYPNASASAGCRSVPSTAIDVP